MSVSIARKSLLYDWRRFLPAVFAVAFSGVLIICQGALLLGIVGVNSLYVTASRADFWTGFRGTQSVELGRTIMADAVSNLYSDKGIANVEAFLLGSGDWRRTGSGGVSVTIVGIDVNAGALALARVVPSTLRNALKEPDTVVVDEGDSDKLDIKSGETAEISGRKVRVIGLIRGLRGLGGVNIVTSLDTAIALDRTLPSSGGATYYLSRAAPAEAETTILERLNKYSISPSIETWKADDLAAISTNYMLMESGAGIAFVFATLIALFIGALITSQTLLSAVAGNVPQYATLRALGVSFGDIRVIVIEQAAWVGIFGFILSFSVSLIISTFAEIFSIPYDLRLTTILGASVALLLVAIFACVIAIQRLRETDPATLLR